MPERERVLVAAMLGSGLLLRVFYLLHYRFNTDEPQHLHVAWEWTHGWVQYRDFFDNHAPLFHLLTAPIAAWVGERSDILYIMRAVMIPYVLVTLACTYLLGRRLFGARTGLWAAAILSLLPSFLFTSLEYRTDVQWMMFWLLALVVLVTRSVTWRRALLGGFLIGAACATSLKTTLLLGMLGGAGLLVSAQQRSSTRHFAWRNAVHVALCFVAGLIILPLALVATFSALGASGQLWYATVQHNLIMETTRHGLRFRNYLFIPAVLLLAVVVPRVAALAPPGRVRRRIALLMYASGLYLAAALTLWTLFTPHYLLPFAPVAAVVAAWLLLLGIGRLRPGSPSSATRSRGSGTWLLAGIAAVQVTGILLAVSPFANQSLRQKSLLEEVLRLTGPEDYILDIKGETVFRHRPYYFVLETITRWGLENGLIHDTIVPDLVAHRTYIVTNKVNRFPAEAATFLTVNYLPAGMLRVAGQIVTPGRGGPEDSARFLIAIPGRYAVVSESGAAPGRVDGHAYVGARFFDAGEHEIVPGAGNGRVAVVWAQAVERGFTPFSQGDSR